MKKTFPAPTTKKLLTLAVIACMCASLLLGASANAYVKPANRIANPVKRVSNAYPNLRRFGLDLTKLARLGRIQAIQGYDAEIAHVIETLSNTEKAPVLVGESS